jgi:HlyD family secretion protein
MKACRLFSLLTLAGLFLAACSSPAPSGTPAQSALPPAAVASVSSEGRVFPVQSADLSFSLSGNVAEVLVKEGDPVQADQVIARLVNTEGAESTLAGAQKAATVATAQQALATAQQGVAAAQQAELAAQVEVVNARKAVTDLVDSSATALNLAQAQMKIADLQNQIADAQRNLGYLITPDLKYYRDQVARAQDALTNAKQDVTLVDVSQLQIDLRNAQTQLETATNVYHNAKDAFAKCPTCLTVFAYDRTTTWQDAVNLYDDAVTGVQQIQTQIDQTQRGGSLSVSAAQDDLTTATNHLNYYLKGPDAVKLAQAQADIGMLQAQLAKAQSDAVKLKADNGADPDKLKAAQDQVDAAGANLVSAQAGVASAQAAAVAAQAGLVAAQLKQDSVELRAPFAGTVAVQKLKVGEHVDPGLPVVTLADLSQWEVQTDDLTELEVVHIQAGQTVTVELDALPGVMLSGKVKSVAAKYVENRGDITYTTTITLTSTDPQMRWGMTAKVTFAK